MRILGISSYRYRSLKQTFWMPGDLNVVIGPNGSGKSNLLRALGLISASAAGRLDASVQAAGGLDSFLWDGVGDQLSLYTILSEGERGDRPMPGSLWPAQRGAERPLVVVGFALHAMGRGGRHLVSSEALSLVQSQSALDALQRSPPGLPADPQTGALLMRDAHRAYVLSDKGVPVDATDIPEGETLLSQVRGPFSANRRVAAARQELADWAIYHDLRVDQEASLRRPAVARFEPRLAPDGQNLINVLHTHYAGDRAFKRDVDDAMKAAFGDDFEELLFPPASDQRIQLRLRWRSLRREASAADLSDGTLRFLLLLTALRAPSPPPLVAIDEPEAGLHPSMLPIIAEHAVDAAARTQVILTTHSPQLLDAFRGTRPTTTIARWHDGETQLKVVDEERLAYWLQEYSLGALFRSGELEALG